MVTSVNPNAPVARVQNGEKQSEDSMNGDLTPNEIGMEFVRQYYTLMNEAPDLLYRLYSKESKFVHGNITGKQQVPIIGQEVIFWIKTLRNLLPNMVGDLTHGSFVSEYQIGD